MKISVIISTYNRCYCLSELFHSLLLQKYDGSFDYEIIVVDNNSIDNTKEIINSFTKDNPRIRYIFEPKQGISNARNAGINNAKGEVLAFIDDDVLIDEDWLSNIARFSSACDFDAAGGKVEPIYPANTPQWIKDYKDILNGPIPCHDQGENVKLYDKTMLPFIGANMVIKRKVFEQIKGFNPGIGAGKGSIGEDTELFHRIQSVGYKIYYNPNILLFHPVIKERTNFIYFAKWHMASGRYSILKDYTPDELKSFICYFGVPRYLFRQILNLFFSLLLSMRNKRIFIKAWGTLFWKIGMAQAYRSKSL